MSKKRKHIVVKPEIHKKLKQKALDDGISMEKTINKILKKELKDEKNDKNENEENEKK